MCTETTPTGEPFEQTMFEGRQFAQNTIYGKIPNTFRSYEFSSTNEADRRGLNPLKNPILGENQAAGRPNHSVSGNGSGVNH